jgi:hypothetical protein
MIASPTNAGNLQMLREVAEQLDTFVHQAAEQALPIHEVEHGLWQQLLALGHALLEQFLALHGSGDLGATVTLPSGQTCQRLAQLHRRPYTSIFGHFTLWRTAYGSREGQKIDFVPLDQRLQLPASAFSYLLQDWDQALCVEQAFDPARSTVARMLGLQQSVDSLEHMNVQMAADVQHFRENRPRPEPATEGAVFVVGADGKGIILRRPADAPAPKAHRSKGEKASLKRMAIVGTCYSVDRFVRTPEQIVAALFRDDAGQPRPQRPEPCHQRVWASLPQLDPRTGQLRPGQHFVYDWLLNELAERNPGLHQEVVYLHDGQESLWQARQDYLPHKNGTDVLDLLHVTPRLWRAAHLFHAENSPAAERLVRVLLLRVLRGETAQVVQALRRRGRRRNLRGAQRQALAQLCGYLSNNQERMRYHEYLAKGYPIASGAIEGACRHLVKDRMERAGMHWTLAGAQAMLDVRSTYIHGDWDEYQRYRIERENQRLYPYRHLVEGPLFQFAV